MGDLWERLREKYSNASDNDGEMRAFYDSCEAITTTLVCDWIRNEAENGDLEPLEVSGARNPGNARHSTNTEAGDTLGLGRFVPLRLKP